VGKYLQRQANWLAFFFTKDRKYGILICRYGYCPVLYCVYYRTGESEVIDPQGRRMEEEWKKNGGRGLTIYPLTTYTSYLPTYLPTISVLYILIKNDYLLTHPYSSSHLLSFQTHGTL